MEKIIPLGNRVLIEPVETPNKTKGGFKIPETAKQKPLTGKVLEIGEEVKVVKKGDIVMYGKNSGTEINDKGWLMMIEPHITAILKK